MLFANLRFIKAINKMAKVKSMLNNIGVIRYVPTWEQRYIRRNVLWTSSKRPEKSSLAILNLYYKCIFIALFSILFYQKCV